MTSRYGLLAGLLGVLVVVARGSPARLRAFLKDYVYHPEERAGRRLAVTSEPMGQFRHWDLQPVGQIARTADNLSGTDKRGAVGVVGLQAKGIYRRTTPMSVGCVPTNVEGRQTCKACGRVDYWNFDVPTEVWTAVIPAELRNRVVCLGCFAGLLTKEALDTPPRFGASFSPETWRRMSYECIGLQMDPTSDRYRLNPSRDTRCTARPTTACSAARRSWKSATSSNFGRNAKCRSASVSDKAWKAPSFEGRFILTGRLRRSASGNLESCL